MIANKTAIGIGAVWVALGASIYFMSGCALDDLVQVSVPKGVQTATQTASTIKLSDAEYTWTEWQNFVDVNTAKFQESIDDANKVWGVASSVVNIGADSAAGPLSQLPGGAALVSGLSLATGLFLRHPGDAKREAKEKERSFNAGLAQAKALVETAPKS